MKFKNFRELSKHDFVFALKIFLIVAACGTACYFSYLNSSWLILLCAGILGIINLATVHDIGRYSSRCYVKAKYNMQNSLLYFVMTYAIMALIPIDFYWKIVIILAITIPFNIFRLFIESFLWNKQGFSSLKKQIDDYTRNTSYRKKRYHFDSTYSLYVIVIIVLGIFLFVLFINSPEFKARVAKQEAVKIERIKKDVVQRIKSQEASSDGIYKILGEGQQVMIVDTVLTEILCGDTYYTFVSKDNKIATGCRRVSEEMLFTRKGHKITFKCSESGSIQTFDNLNVILVKNY